MYAFTRSGSVILIPKLAKSNLESGLRGFGSNFWTRKMFSSDVEHSMTVRFLSDRAQDLYYTNRS